MKKYLLLAVAAIVLCSLLVIGLTKEKAGAPKLTAETSTSNGDFDKEQFSLTDANSVWVIVNKKNPLQVGYVPENLVSPAVKLRLNSSNEEMKVREDAAKAMEKMFSDASAAGLNLMLVSGYRSEALQKTVYNGYVTQKGQAAADLDSARPGYSEHQTGLAFDVGRADRKCEVDPCFAETPEGKWAAENAHKYGFVIRYLPDKRGTTGYVPEAWHLRYVGTDLATAVHERDTTLEEFFDLPAAPDYN